MKKQIAIIGSGIAGLASAIRLAKLGFEVKIFEKNNFAGGKINELLLNGYRFDTGPSVLTLPELLDELIETSGFKPEDLYHLYKLENLCRYFYPDGTILNAYSDVNRFAEEAEQVSGEPAENIINYLNKSRKMFEHVSDIFLSGSSHILKTFKTEVLKKFICKWKKLDSLTSMHKRNTKSFKTEKLVQLFDHYATYLGSNPYKIPATYNIISHLEHNVGSFIPKGGMRKVISVMVDMCEKLGVKIELNSFVEKVLVNKNKIEGIVVNGKNQYCDIVICNSDIHYFRNNLIDTTITKQDEIKQELSSSAIIFYWGMDRTFDELDTHNILFSGNYEEEFEYLFNYKTLYKDPTVYLFISSKLNPEDAPAKSENWFCMINSPHVEGHCWETMVQKVKKIIIDKINKTLFCDISRHIETESVLHPQMIEQITHSYKGALYGQSSNSRFSVFKRQPNFDRKIKGLYYAGGTVHPGGGIPLCLLSAKIVAELIQKKYM